MDCSSNAALFYNTSRGTGVEEGIEQMKFTDTVEKKLVFANSFCESVESFKIIQINQTLFASLLGAYK